MSSTLDLEIQTTVRRLAGGLLARRSLNGFFTYPAVQALCLSPAGLASVRPGAALVLLVLQFGLSYARFIEVRRCRADASGTRSLGPRLGAIVLGQAVVATNACGLGVLELGNTQTTMVAILAAVGLVMGTVYNLHVRRHLTAALILILLLPVMTIEATMGGGWLVVAALSIALVYSCFQNRSLHRETMQSLYNSELLARRSAELAEAHAEVAAASRSKSQFLATMSHEMRTPINGVLGMTELALETPLSAEQREFITAARDSGRRLQAVVGDILDYSKIESGELDLCAAPFDPRELALQLVAPLRGEALRKGLRLSWQVSAAVPAELVGDEQRLGQVILNLLSNGVKFTPAGSVILVLDGVPDGDRFRLRVSVRDTGPGIAAEEHERIFQPFQQAACEASRRVGGTGLGLAISTRLVRSLGGELTLDTTVGRGCDFHFELSLARGSRQEAAAAAATAATSAAPAVACPPLRILVAEDNPVNRRFMEAFLQKRGHRVTFAEHGGAALAALQASEFDVVLMDVEMPELDGLTVTVRLREIEAARGGHTPVIALTAHATSEVRDRCLAAGMDEFMTKPVSLPRLQGLLQEIALAEPCLS